MKLKPKAARKISRVARESCSIETLKGLQVSVAELTAREKPEDPRDAFVTARQWARSNYFLGGLQSLHTLFLNYGLKLAPAEPAQLPAFDAWLAGDAGRIEMHVEKYVLSAGAEWLLQDNLVSFWRDRANYPYPLPAVRCTYMMFGDDKAQLAGKRTAGSAGLKTLCKSLAWRPERDITGAR